MKAALLYADEVSVASLGTASLEAARELMAGSDELRVRRMLRVASVLLAPDQRSLLSVVLGSRKARRHVPGYQEMERSMLPMVQEIEAVVEMMRADAGADELDAAVGAGLLRIEPLGLDPVQFVQQAILRAKYLEDLTEGVAATEPPMDAGMAAIEVLLRIISDTVAPTSDSYPLLDKEASDIVRTMIETPGSIPVSRLPGAQAGLAATFVGALPAFPDATVPEVIEVRRAAGPALTEFRSAVAKMAMDVRDAQWKPGFDHEAKALFTANVEPALNGVAEQLRSLGVLSLAGHAAPYAIGAGTGTFTLALAATQAFPEIASLGLGTSVGAGVGFAALAGLAEGMRERLKRKKLLGQNQFLWLARVDEKLGRRASR